MLNLSRHIIRHGDGTFQIFASCYANAETRVALEPAGFPYADAREQKRGGRENLKGMINRIFIIYYDTL